MQNYFNYFTEIEQRFQQRRGSILMLSTLDWALIETWQEAGIPLEAVLRGIDSAFDKYDAKAVKGRKQKINGLAWTAQAVLEAVEQAQEAAIGMADPEAAEIETGFEQQRVAAYLERNAATIEKTGVSAETVARLRELAGDASLRLEDLDRTLTVLEERLFAAVMTATSEDEMVGLREQAARELAPYRGKMQAVQIKQIQQQFMQKRLFEARGIPRLSLFYMGVGD